MRSKSSSGCWKVLFSTHFRRFVFCPFKGIPAIPVPKEKWNSLRNPDWITCLKLFYHIVNTFRKVPDDIFMISIKYFERYRYFWNTKDFHFALMGFWPKSIRAKWKSFVFWHWKTKKTLKKWEKAQKHRVPPCDLAKKPKITRGDPMFLRFLLLKKYLDFFL